MSLGRDGGNERTLGCDSSDRTVGLTARSALNCRPAPLATRAAAALPLGRARAAHAQASPAQRADAELRVATWQGLDQHPL